MQDELLVLSFQVEQQSMVLQNTSFLVFSIFPYSRNTVSCITSPHKLVPIRKSWWLALKNWNEEPVFLSPITSWLKNHERIQTSVFFQSHQFDLREGLYSPCVHIAVCMCQGRDSVTVTQWYPLLAHFGVVSREVPAAFSRILSGKCFPTKKAFSWSRRQKTLWKMQRYSLAVKQIWTLVK